MTIRNLLGAGVASLALAHGLPATAGSIDYGSLEQMFNEPVTTSATGSPQRASQAPVDMDIISAEDIRRSGASDLPTILSRVAGVDLLRWSAGAADVAVRGYNGAMNSRLLVLVNGRQVYLDFYGYTAWSTLPVRLEEIRQIEVVKGPNAALFGFNAVSGVINIITFNPQYDDVSFASARAGDQGFGEASLGHTVKLGDRFAARLTAGASTQAEFDGSLSGFHDPVERLTASLDTVTKLTDNVDLRLEGGWSRSQQNEMSAMDYLPFEYLVRHVNSTLNWDSAIGSVQLNAYQNRVTAKVPNSGDIRNEVTVMSAQNLVKLGTDHAVRLMAEYRETDMPLGGGASIGYKVKSAGAMWNWQALEKLSLTAAARYDDLELSREGPFPAGLPITNSAFDRTITNPSYNAGVVWMPTAQDTLRLTYARGAQMPSLFDLGFQAEVTPGSFFLGNPTLQTTIVTNYGLSYDRAIPQINGSASLRLFHQESRNLRGQPDFGSPLLLGPLALFVFQNVSDSEMQGVETVAKGVLGDVRWSANYTYTSVDDSPRNNVGLFASRAAFAATTPEHRANFSAGWDQGPWSVNGFLRVQSEMSGYPATGNAPVKVAPYAALDGRVAYQLADGLSVALNGQNLGSDEQRQTASLLVPRKVFLSIEKTW